MRREDLGSLAMFVAVAEEQSFTRAASKLGISQSALSHSMRRLEARLGLRLLTRTTRSVATTEAGERLLETLRPALDEIDLKLGGSVTGKATGVSGSLGFAPGDLGHFTFKADTVDITLGSYLDLTAAKIAVDTSPSAGNDLLDVSTVAATFKLPGGLNLTGSGQNFGVAPDGTFVTQKNFGVSLTVDNSGELKWPSWLPRSTK